MGKKDTLALDNLLKDEKYDCDDTKRLNNCLRDRQKISNPI
jgi:hypothetical protein